MYVYTTYLFTVYVWEEFLCTCSKYLSLYLSSKSCSVHVYLIYIINMSFSIFFYNISFLDLHMRENDSKFYTKILEVLVNQFWQQRHTQTVTKAAETWMDSILLLLIWQFVFCFRLPKTARGQILVCWRFSSTNKSKRVR